ncbi:DNA polymerase/primase [Enterococcus phage vB_EfaS_9592-1]|nr:DNA polymerase/primase [Enterococcus phage vB_EfaS_9592-1]
MELLRLKKNGKAPLVAGSFNGEDKAEVKKWVAEGYNYGILTGKISGIAVIDIDTHNGVSGADNLKEFCEKYDIELPDTKTVMTPSGGMHLYYNLPENYNEIQFIQNHKELEGVDFQTTGRYVVGWGSKIDGVKYEVINNSPIADLPEKWFELFKDKTIQKKNKKRKRLWTANLLGDIIAGCDEGSRNNWIAQMTGKLFATGLEHSEVEVWVQYVNQMGCNPPLPKDEVMRTFESVRKREIRRMEND